MSPTTEQKTHSSVAAAACGATSTGGGVVQLQGLHMWEREIRKIFTSSHVTSLLHRASGRGEVV